MAASGLIEPRPERVAPREHGHDRKPTTLSRRQENQENTHVGAGVTVVSRKLEQSAERTLRGERPSRVPVTARLQLLPAQARSTRTLPKANETKERTATTEAFILTDWFPCDRQRGSFVWYQLLLLLLTRVYREKREGEEGRAKGVADDIYVE